MKNHYLLPPYPLHHRIHLIRFFSGISQVEMARYLNGTQSSLSRLEAGTSELTAGQLMALRDRFEISADQILEGTIPYLDLLRKAERGPSLPEKYTMLPDSRVRFLHGPIQLLEERLGPQKVLALLDRLGVAPEFLAEPRLQINIRLFWDLIYLAGEDHLKMSKEIWNGFAAAMFTGHDLGTDRARSMLEAFEAFSKLHQSLTRNIRFLVKPVATHAAGQTIHFEVSETLPAYRTREKTATIRDYSMRYQEAIIHQFVERSRRAPAQLRVTGCRETAVGSTKRTRLDVQYEVKLA